MTKWLKKMWMKLHYPIVDVRINETDLYPKLQNLK